MPEGSDDPGGANQEAPAPSSNVIDAMFAKRGTEILDSDTMILETQKRVWAALKKGYTYAGITDDSEKFLRKNVFAKLDMVVLYVDLVGSTTMTLELPVEKLAKIINSFSQEMASMIHQHNGFVLKFVGDAVIGYFVAGGDKLRAARDGVSCARSMNKIIQEAINPVLNQYDYPDLMVKIGMDFGQSIVIRYGSNPSASHIDLIGSVMNMAAKIQSMAKPNEILIGNDVYRMLHPEYQESFREVIMDAERWKYRSRRTGEIYKVYELVPKR